MHYFNKMISITAASSLIGKAIGKKGYANRPIAWVPRHSIKLSRIRGYWAGQDNKNDRNFVLTRSSVSHRDYLPGSLQACNFISMLNYLRPASDQADIADEWVAGIGCFSCENINNLEEILKLAVDSYELQPIGGRRVFELIVHYHGSYRSLWHRLRLLLTVAQGEYKSHIPATELNSTLTDIGVKELEALNLYKLTNWNRKKVRNYGLSGAMGLFWTRVRYDRLK